MTPYIFSAKIEITLKIKTLNNTNYETSSIRDYFSFCPEMRISYYPLRMPNEQLETGQEMYLHKFAITFF